MTKRFCSVVAALAALLVVPIARAQSSHAFLWTADGGMQDLGVPAGSTDSIATSISNSGQVVGYLVNSGGNMTAALWTSATGWRPLKKGLSSRFSIATGVNSSGQIVGITDTAQGAQHAFLWTQAHGMQDLGTLGGDFSDAHGINRLGQIVGESSTSDGFFSHAFSWSQSVGMQDLGTLQGASSRSVADAVSDKGIVVGGATALDNLSVAVLWKADHIHALGNLGFNGQDDPQSGATGINNAGQVVGSYTTSITTQPVHAFLWTQTGGVQDLGTLPGATSSSAAGINGSGEVVGSNLMPDGSSQAFVWTSISGMKALGTLGGPTSVALGINDAGQVVGYSTP